MGRAFVNRTYNLEHSASTPNLYLQASLGFTIVWHQGLLSFYRLSLCFGGHAVAQWLATVHRLYARGRGSASCGLDGIGRHNHSRTVVGDCGYSCLVWGIASIYGGFPITISKPSFEGHRFCPLLFSRKSKIFRMSIPSSLRKVGCMPPTMTTFRKLFLICFSDLSSCSVFSSDSKA